MTVIPFYPFRFTPADIREFERVAMPKLQRGLWSGISRHSGSGFDCIRIRLPGIGWPVFSFERDRCGTYHLLFNDRVGGWCTIGRGESATECLSVWRTRAPALSAPSPDGTDSNWADSTVDLQAWAPAAWVDRDLSS